MLRSQLKKGDVLLNIVGASIGRACVYDKDEEANINQAVCLIRPKKINSYWLAHLLNSSIYQNVFTQSKSGSSRDNIDLYQVRELEIPIHSKELQNTIAEKLNNAYDLKKSREEQANDIVKGVDEIIAQKIGFEFPKVEVKNTFAIRVSAFESRLDPHFYLPNFKELLDNIRKTKYAQLENLVEFSKETWNQKDGFENEFPYIEISEIDLSSGKINNVSLVPIAEAPSRAKMVVRENDIIISTTRPNRGAISLIEKDKDGFIASTGFAILRNLKTKDISKEYLFYMLRTQICLLQILQRSSGGSYPAITAEELKNIYIPIPSKEIQQEIVKDIKAFITQAEQLKENAKTEFEKAKQEIEKMILE